MQAQELQAVEAKGANGFAMPKHYRNSSRDRTSFSAHAPDSGTLLDSQTDVMDEQQTPSGRPSMDSDVREKKSSSTDASSNESCAQGSTESSDSLSSADMTWGDAGSADSSENNDTATFKRHYGPYRTSTDMDKKTHQRPPLPPRLSGHGRSHSNGAHLAALSPVTNHTIPSPLASPVTATANSLTALSISQTHSAFSGRDLSKITVPRERKKTRPYSIASADALLAQERRHNGQDEDSSHDQSGRLSDPETTRRQQGHGSTKQPAKGNSKVEPEPSTTATSAVSNGSKPTDIKPSTLKSAAQLRVNLYNLVSTGYLPADTLAIFREHCAVVTAKGTLIPQFKEADAITLYPWLQSEYETPSAWATAMVKGGRTGKVAVNGWSAIKIPILQVPELSKMFEGQGLTEVSLDVLRKRYLADMTEDGSGQAEGGSSHTGKGSAVMDRKKRKRPVIAAAEKIELRITTQTGTAVQKGRSGITRPRKRTMSDLSGMVSSDIMQDRQLHLEAAGALFAMQDPFSSPTLGTYTRHGTRNQGSRQRSHRHKHPVPLESLARHRQEQELLWSHSSRTRVSALRAVKALSLAPAMAPLGLSLSKNDETLCVLCGTTGEVITPRRRRSTLESSSHRSYADGKESSANNVRYSQGAMKRCLDCGDYYHLDCIPPDTTTGKQASLQAGNSRQCPRCTICSCCRKSVHEVPSLHSSKGAISGLAAQAATSEDIQIISCDKCHQSVHLQCQLVREPTLKDIIRSSASRSLMEWICLDCRECVECGCRAAVATDVDMVDEDFTTVSESKESGIGEGRWSNGCALCPSCTTLAEKGNICPLCCRTYEDDDYETPMIFCDGCSLWVHVACDKGLQDRDYEELGEDSKQYFCPSCIPTPIPSPTHSSSSSVFSAVNSVEQSPWQGPHVYGSQRADSTNERSREPSSGNEEDWQHHGRHGRKRKDDIMDLLKAAQEISDSESQANSPYSNYSPMFPSTHSRTMSASLESVAEVAAAEALLTIFSGANTPVNSTPYTSYPPSPFEPSFNSFGGIYDRHYSVVNTLQDLPPLMRSLAFTPSSSSDQESAASATQECQGVSSCRCQRHRDIAHIEDYFNSRPYSRRQSVPYHQIGQELQILETNQSKQQQQHEVTTDSGDVEMKEAGSAAEAAQGIRDRNRSASTLLLTDTTSEKNETPDYV
ncbi:hypothetical protein BGZ58_001877 [Dissophora ornata]|nr:hypothetical protein BGZ58_001877 [Dissophora ornata]